MGIKSSNLCDSIGALDQLLDEKIVGLYNLGYFNVAPQQKSKKCTTLIVLVREMACHNTGAIPFHAQLGLTDKGVMCDSYKI